MKNFGLGSYALSGCVALAMLAGCGGSQPPIGAPGAMPQTTAIATHVDRGTSWMLPGAQDTKKLLYVSDSATDDVYVYDYPKGMAVGKLTGFDYPDGQCVDASGDVYITNFEGGNVVEYAHGGTEPIKTLTTNGNAVGCSVSPSGDLAVTNFSTKKGPGNVLIFKSGSGEPTAYSDPSDCYYLWPAGYDDNGNLFAEGEYTSVGVCWLPAGGTSMSAIGFGQQISFPGSVMWTGKSLALTDQNYGNYQTGLYIATLSGSSLHLVGKVGFSDTCNGVYADVAQPFLVGRHNTPVNKTAATVVIGGNLWCSNVVDFWSFLQGGNPHSTLTGAPQAPDGQSVSFGKYADKTTAPETLAPSPRKAPRGLRLPASLFSDAKTGRYLAYVSTLRTGADAVSIFPEKPEQYQVPFGRLTDGVSFPYGLYIDAKGNLYVCNWNENTVTKYKLGSSQPSTTYTQDLSAPLYPILDAKGDLFVSNSNGTVVEYMGGSASNPRVLQTDGTEADGMDFDKRGNLYVAFRGGVYGDSIDEFTNGLKRHRILGMVLHWPQGLVVDKNGVILVVSVSTRYGNQIDEYLPRSKSPKLTLDCSASLVQLAINREENRLFVSSIEGIVYEINYPLKQGAAFRIGVNSGSSGEGVALVNGQTF
ncbi:MAG: SMP-30/gluconolactonase/LRE family protein [Candidatus Cybelea sp.]